MRMHRPIGTWLLLWPCWWSLVWAIERAPASGREWLHLAWLYALFGIGAVVMRGAGCTYNDIVDRDFDAKVMHLFDFLSYADNHLGIDPISDLSHKRFAAEFEKNSPEPHLLFT